MVDDNHTPTSAGGYQKCPTFNVKAGERAWVQLDLKEDHQISKVTLWQYYTDGRAYLAQGVAVSKTGRFQTEDTVWLLNRGLNEAGPPSTRSGMVVNAPENTVGRFIRIYSGPDGKGRFTGAHFIDLAVEGGAVAGVKVTCE